MTLTEEQREAIRVISKLPMAIGCQLCHPYIMKNYGSHFIVLRDMIDSSGTVEPTGGFDLEKARAVDIDLLATTDWGELRARYRAALAEIERLRAKNLELQVAVFGPDGIRANQACIIADQAARISDLEIEITGLKADLEQSEEIKRLKDELENYGDHYACLLISKDAQIKELEGMLSIRTEELDIAHSVARSEKEMHEKELAAFARRIKELEDALVEGLTNFLHYRASCYDPARRCPYAKECDDCSTWDACGHVEMFRSEARRQLQADGKIGPDAAKPQSWQITEERKETLRRALEEYKIFPNDQAVLRAMLREAE
jgi:hypothetical protein